MSATCKASHPAYLMRSNVPCALPAGHKGDHEGHIAGDPDIYVWPVYKPSQCLAGQASPQNHVEWFADAEVRAEIAHLRRIDKRFGSNPIRQAAVNKLAAVLAERAA